MTQNSKPDPCGDLSADRIDALGDLFRRLSTPPGTLALLNLAETTRLDAEGLSLLLRLRSSVESTGGSLCLADAQPDIAAAFRFLGLGALLNDSNTKAGA